MPAGEQTAQALWVIEPASTLLEVRALIYPDLLVEIEADAVAGGAG